MDSKMLDSIKNTPLFHNKEVMVTPLSNPQKEEEGSTFKLECEGKKSLLRVDNSHNIVGKELEAWLTLAHNNLSMHRPDIYYISPTFSFSISEFYEEYTSIGELQLTEIEKGIIAKHLLRIVGDYHTIMSDEYDLKAIVKNECNVYFTKGVEQGLITEEERKSIFCFLDQISFGKVATYNHRQLMPENILYNSKLQDVKIIHMRNANFTDPIYDYIYMTKTLDKEITQAFIPVIQNYNPQIVQILSLLCDIQLYLKEENKKTQQNLDYIHTQIQIIQEQITTIQK